MEAEEERCGGRGREFVCVCEVGGELKELKDDQAAWREVRRGSGA